MKCLVGIILLILKIDTILTDRRAVLCFCTRARRFDIDEMDIAGRKERTEKLLVRIT